MPKHEGLVAGKLDTPRLRTARAAGEDGDTEQGHRSGQRHDHTPPEHDIKHGWSRRSELHADTSRGMVNARLKTARSRFSEDRDAARPGSGSATVRSWAALAGRSGPVPGCGGQRSRRDDLMAVSFRRTRSIWARSADVSVTGSAGSAASTVSGRVVRKSVIDAGAVKGLQPYCWSSERIHHFIVSDDRKRECLPARHGWSLDEIRYHGSRDRIGFALLCHLGSLRESGSAPACQHGSGAAVPKTFRPDLPVSVVFAVPAEFTT